jgi:VanZ family protein
MKKLSKMAKFYLPIFLWMGVIFVLSSRQRISVSETQNINFLFFKTLHVIEYSFLFFLVNRALVYASPLAKKYQQLTAFMIVLVYAISDELHQTLVPTREGTLRDVIIDGGGALFVWIFLTHIIPKLPKKLQRWGKHWQLF